MGRADGNARGKHGVGSSHPVPPSDYKIHLPADQYLHVGAPTEWWWHVGTLKADDRIFGFEINAAGYPAFTPVAKYAFTQVMLTDVSNVRHYQQTTPYLPPHVDLSTWAESDPTKDWYARLGKPSDQSYVAMDAPRADPTRNMAVRARLVDGTTQVDFDLMLSQQGPPLLVFGTGVGVNHDKSGPPIQVNNYYYSLTRLDASGTIKIGANSFPSPARPGWTTSTATSAPPAIRSPGSCRTRSSTMAGTS